VDPDKGRLERLLLASPDELRDMIAVSVATMLRIDELLHLHHDDIDLEARLITVQRGRDGTTRSGKVRHVPILDSVLDILRRRRLKRGASPLVFPGKGGGVRAQTPVTCAFKAALRRAQMDESLVWHALRHTGASWWVMSGGRHLPAVEVDAARGRQDHAEDVRARGSGSVALSSDGSTLTAGAHGEASAATGIDGNQADNSAPLAGAVYVFH
jgi:integrase